MGNQRLAKVHAPKNESEAPTRAQQNPQASRADYGLEWSSNCGVNQAIAQQRLGLQPSNSVCRQSPTFRGLSSEIGGAAQSQGLVIQPKLVIGQPNDKYEQEADRVAKQVVQQLNTPGNVQPDAAPTLQREVTDDYLQMQPMPKSQSGAAEATPGLEQSIQRMRGSGEPLPDSIREPMERSFGADFGEVRIHANSQVDKLTSSISARAFTAGEDIFMFKELYKPNNNENRELLAHELAHVLQQRNTTKLVQRQGDEDKNDEDENIPLTSIESSFSNSISIEITEDDNEPDVKALEIQDDRFLTDEQYKSLCKDLNLLMQKRKEDDFSGKGKAEHSLIAYDRKIADLSAAIRAHVYRMLEGKSPKYKVKSLIDDEKWEMLEPYQDTEKTFGPDRGEDYVKYIKPQDLSRCKLSSKMGQDSDVSQNELAISQQVKRQDAVFSYRGEVFTTQGMKSPSYAMEKTRNRAIFVMTGSGEIYVADSEYEYRDGPRIHHSSFLEGLPVAAAGEVIFDREGHLTGITNKSGHYRPTPKHMIQAVKEFKERGVDMKNVKVLLVGEWKHKDKVFKTELCIDADILLGYKDDPDDNEKLTAWLVDHKDKEVTEVKKGNDPFDDGSLVEEEDKKDSEKRHNTYIGG